MNKVQIGQYLKKLRIENGYSRTAAAEEIGTTYKSILDWEKGVMPSDESLLDLANLYKVKVDDILECGHQITKDELYEKYPLLKPIQFGMKIEPKKDLYTPYQASLIVLNTRLKELILLFKKRLLTRSEDQEFRILFNNMCSFSNFSTKYIKNKNTDPYLSFIKVLNDCKIKCKTNPEYYFEVRKYIDIKKHGYVSPFPEYGVPEKDIYKDEQFKSLENWEKDFYLASIQNSDVIVDCNNMPSYLKDYEDRYGEPFDKEKAIKKLIKYFIENGAVLNPWLFSFIKEVKIEHDVLETLEEIYIDYFKPIFIEFHNPFNETDADYKYAYVENNKENRFLDNFNEYYLPLITDKKIDPHQILNLFRNADEKTIVDFLYDVRKKHTDEEKINYSLKKANVSGELKMFYSCRERFLKDEQKATNKLGQLKDLEQKLEQGGTKFYEYYLEDISKTNGFDHFSLMKQWKNQLSYYEFLKRRNHKMTKQLLEGLDQLSLKEIREKFFAKEVIKNG